jgi:hypothetical protein
LKVPLLMNAAPAGAGTARHVLANSEHRHGHLLRRGSRNSAPRIADDQEIISWLRYSSLTVLPPDFSRLACLNCHRPFSFLLHSNDHRNGVRARFWPEVTSARHGRRRQCRITCWSGGCRRGGPNRRSPRRS